MDERRWKTGENFPCKNKRITNNNKNMNINQIYNEDCQEGIKHIGIALIYIAFFSLIGFSLWVTKSVWVLLALIFTPEYS